MTESLIFLLTSLLIFLVLTEVITLRVLCTPEEQVIIIDLMIFGIEINLGDKKNTSERKKKKHQKAAKPQIMATKYAAEYLLSKSTIRISYLDIRSPSYEPSDAVLRHAGIASALSAIFALAEAYSKKFSFDNIFIGTSDNNKTELNFDISIEAHILALVATLSIFIFKKLTGMLGEKKNVGKQNE